MRTQRSDLTATALILLLTFLCAQAARAEVDDFADPVDETTTQAAIETSPSTPLVSAPTQDISDIQPVEDLPSDFTGESDATQQDILDAVGNIEPEQDISRQPASNSFTQPQPGDSDDDVGAEESSNGPGESASQDYGTPEPEAVTPYEELQKPAKKHKSKKVAKAKSKKKKSKVAKHKAKKKKSSKIAKKSKKKSKDRRIASAKKSRKSRVR